MGAIKISYPCRVRRLLVRVVDSNWEIVRDTRISSKTLAKSQEFPAGSSSRYLGFCFEVLDANGQVLYRRIGNDPLNRITEYVDDGGVLRCTHASGHEALIDVLFPDLPQVEAVRFFSSTEAPLEIDRQTDSIRNQPNAKLIVKTNK